MSDFEYHRGKLKLITRLDNESLEDQCKRLLDDKPLKSYYDTYEEMLRSELYKQYVIYKDSIYLAEDQEIEPYSDVFVSYKNNDETINYEVKYYNGGCGFSEAIEKALKNIK